MTNSKTPRSGSSRARRLLLRRTVLRPLNIGLLVAFIAGLGLIAFKQTHAPQRRAPQAASIAVVAAPPAGPAPVTLPFNPLQTLSSGYGQSAAPTALNARQVATLLQYEEPAALATSVPVAPALVVQRPVPAHVRPRIAIVIDDIGPDWPNSKAAAALPGPLTLALLPYAEKVQELAARGQKNGHELIIHMPMEPLDRAHNNPGPIALLVGQPAAEQQGMLARAFNSFAGYVGVNNHMGSRFTADLSGMQLLMGELASRQLYFLDSRTTPKSVGLAQARRHGVAAAGRDVFLDNVQDTAKILQQLRQTERVARAQGSAIAIGHPHPQTIAALRQWLPQAKANGFDLVPVSALVQSSPQQITESQR